MEALYQFFQAASGGGLAQPIGQTGRAHVIAVNTYWLVRPENLQAFAESARSFQGGLVSSQILGLLATRVDAEEFANNKTKERCYWAFEARAFGKSAADRVTLGQFLAYLGERSTNAALTLDEFLASLNSGAEGEVAHELTSATSETIAGVITPTG